MDTNQPQATTPSGLKYTDLQPGSGAVAQAGQTAKVHYTGWLKNGAKFDSSLDRHEPFEFTLGAGMVIKRMGRRGRRDEGGGQTEARDPAGVGLRIPRSRWSDPS